MPRVAIPHNFTARPYQVNFLREVELAMAGKSDKRYFMQIWHRRSGKDKTNIADVVPRALISSPKLVKYVYPTLVMGRDNLWDGIGSDGSRYLDHIPKSIRAADANGTRMTIPIKGGSLFQIAGSDNPDSLRGGNAKVYVFSEWSEQDPGAWDVVEPILRENDGIAIFNMTPKGDNHARALYEFAKNHPKWFVETLTAEDTGVFTTEQLAEIKDDIIKRFEANGRSTEEAVAYYDQEYMCSFTSPVIGSYYGAAMRKAEVDGRITSVPYEAEVLVDTFWDLGMDDSMTIWFFQRVGKEKRFIDYYENSGEGLPHYISHLKSKGYNYGNHYGPFDIKVRELGTGKSRLEAARDLGFKFEVMEKLPIEDGINAARSVISSCWFDKDKCSRGILALKNYKKDWDEKNKVFRNNPKHDWASHGSDAFRGFATTQKDQQPQEAIVYQGGDTVTGYGKHIALSSNVVNKGYKPKRSTITFR